MFRMSRWFWCIVLALPLSACDCHDEIDAIWTFYEPYDVGLELDVWDAANGTELDDVEDVGPDGDEDVRDAADVDDADDADVTPDVDPPREGEWQPEVIAEDVPLDHALNDRTSLVVDSEGTMWLGYHACDDRSCLRPQLDVGYRRLGDDWTFERVQPHMGLFGLEIITPGAPIVAYLDNADMTLKVASRLGRDRWSIEALNVTRGNEYDGFDITHDRSRYYVSFASDTRTTVDFLVYNIAEGHSQWRRLPSLAEAHSAARERGLRADSDFHLYLVHRESRTGPYGVARYNLSDNAWRSRAYFDHTHTLSSFVIRANGELCMSFDREAGLMVTCGTMTDLSRMQKIFSERVGGYSSLLEGRDGTLFVAYPSHDNSALRVARRTPTGEWIVETAFEGSAYGVSTAINHDDELALSFYTCSATRCRLQVVEKQFD